MRKWQFAPRSAIVHGNAGGEASCTQYHICTFVSLLVNQVTSLTLVWESRDFLMPVEGFPIGFSNVDDQARGVGLTRNVETWLTFGANEY